MTNLLQKHSNLCENFRGGRISQFLSRWKRLTSDKSILRIVRGVIPDFVTSPSQARWPPPLKFDPIERQGIDIEIAKFLKKQIISASAHEPHEFISNIFSRRKKDGSFRVILNLSDLNEFVKYEKFKMDSLEIALKLVEKGSFFTSLDFKDFYYSVAIHKNYRKYFKFFWNGKLYEFNALPQGFAAAPRLVTRLMKPVFASLRQRGHVSTGFIDDSLLIAPTWRDSCTNTWDSAQLFTDLGFVIHPTKTVFIPCQEIQYLGAIINSHFMHVRLPDDKVKNILSLVDQALAHGVPTIREMARLVGNLVATSPAIEHAQLFYRELELAKAVALRNAHGNFDAPMTSLSPRAHSDLQWWRQNLQRKRRIFPPKIDFVIETDAAGTAGFGAVRLDTGEKLQSLFTAREKETKHINELEAFGAAFAVKAFAKDLRNVHVHVRSDNTTTVAALNRFGSSKALAVNEVARDLWLWCFDRDIWVTASYIPGVDNETADAASRKFHFDLEWKLNPQCFAILLVFFKLPLKIDLFASRINKQLPIYGSLHKDPEAAVCDAFSVNWNDWNPSYIFPPFCIMTRVLQKIKQDECDAVVAFPVWPTQVWWPLLMDMITDDVILFRPSQKLLGLPSDPATRHRKSKSLQLAAARVTGRPTACAPARVRSFDATSQTRRDEIMGLFSKTGTPFVRKKGLIRVWELRQKLS